MDLKAFKVKQQGGLEEINIYISTIAAIDLVENYSIDRWTTDNQNGYQRLPEEGRFRDGKGSIIRYLMKEYGSFPTSILLNVRGSLPFKIDQELEWCTLGTLDLSDKKLWVIDGQHRVEALKRAISRNLRYEKYPVIVSILQLPKRFDELLLFYIVNKRQRGVPTDLAYRHLQTMVDEKGVDWLYDIEGKKGVSLAISANVVDYLCEENNSPWYGLIQRVHEPRLDEHIITDKLMIRSISEILKNKTFGNMQFTDIVDLMIDYWASIKELYPDAFSEPRQYSLLGSPGIFSFHKLFPYIYGQCAQKGMINQEAMQSYLTLLLTETRNHRNPDFKDPLTYEFWSKKNGPIIALATNMQNINDLYRNMLWKIQEALKKS